MSETPKVLGQLSPAAATATKLYTGAANGAVCSLVINNRPASAGIAQVAVEIRVAGGASAAEGFLFEGPATQFMWPPLELIFAVGATDEVWVTSDITNVAFNLTGIEP